MKIIHPPSLQTGETMISDVRALIELVEQQVVEARVVVRKERV